MIDPAPAAVVAPAQDPAYASAVRMRQSGRTQEAAAAFEHLSRERPGDPDVWLNLGLVYGVQGRYDAADQALAAALALAPGYEDARLAYARVALYRGDREEARRRLAPLLAKGAPNPEANALQAQIAAGAGLAQPSWRLDASVSYARLSQDLPPWRTASISLGRSFSNGASVALAVEQTERFRIDDTYLEVRAGRRFGGWSAYVGAGAAPDADYRPETAVLAGVTAPAIALASEWALELAVDASWQRYEVGDVHSVQPYVSLRRGEVATLTLRSINTWDERDTFRAGYAVRALFRAAPGLRLAAGWSDAPESSDGVTVDVKAASLGAAVDIDALTAVRLDLVREGRRAYDRDELSVGVTRRF